MSELTPKPAATAAASTKARRPAHRASAAGGVARNGQKLAHQPGELRLRVLGQVLRHGVSPTDIQKALDVDDVTTIRITLDRLETNGYAAPEGGLWKVTKKGRAYVREVIGWLKP